MLSVFGTGFMCLELELQHQVGYTDVKNKRIRKHNTLDMMCNYEMKTYKSLALQYTTIIIKVKSCFLREVEFIYIFTKLETGKTTRNDGKSCKANYILMTNYTLEMTNVIFRIHSASLQIQLILFYILVTIWCRFHKCHDSVLAEFSLSHFKVGLFFMEGMLQYSILWSRLVATNDLWVLW